MSNRPGSIHSSIAEIPGADYYRDASPLGLSHSSRNLREHASRQSLRSAANGNGNGGSSPYLSAPQPDPRQSMTGLSMWGGGSQYGPPGPGSEMYPMQMQMPMQMQSTGGGYFNPHASFAHPQMQMNPFDSPHSGSDRGSMRGSFYPPYPPQQGMHPGMGAPRNTVMSNLAGMAGPGGGGMPNQRMSTYSLATTANPLQHAGPVEPSEEAEPSDEEVLSVLRRYLAQQDLMSVSVSSHHL
jgi:chitin synthase